MITDRIGKLSAAQRENARIIERVLSAKGVPAEIIAGAVINAMAESSLNPKAIGDGGNSVGLFQLHRKGGGKGMSVAERQDPVKNTERIHQEYVTYGKPLRDAYSRGERSVGEFAKLWAVYIERPADKVGEGRKRSALALKWYPIGVQLVKTDVAAAKVGLKVWLLGGAGLMTLLWLRHRRRTASALTVAPPSE